MKTRPEVLILRTITVGAVLFLTLAGCNQRQETTPKQASSVDSEGHQSWETIVEVLLHPRCLNCHQLEMPLINEGSPHIPRVERGADNMGAGTMRCINCHSNKNNPVTGAPGASGWEMAPITLNWSQMSSAQICKLLTTPQDNGDRSPESQLQFVSETPLALWGWSPGDKRQPVTISHAKLIEAMKEWIAAGTPCPPERSSD
ncbi:hypothetical protein MO867_12940 [Microbulbifer sp. OS29]|uniref:Cytochrome c domain-containing protein n=1 Tax=Microbulbifer okhotskensis TaxID=2926617 RepID=A0A9X2EMZ9_9GAMM|nr:hypothetical protein [Microbulbifer okhotskensis]MCO1335239.1 hypothetical protein [Microbulbifer okhotskensis]